MNTLTTYTTLLVLMTAFSLWTVMRGSLLRAAIGLALVSVVLSVVLFQLGAPLAAVFELSVCAGLITVVFVSTISMTKPLIHEEILKMTGARIKRFWYLPVVIAALALVLALFIIPQLPLPDAVQALPGPTDVREVLWKTRAMDVYGQILVILAGIFGIVILFKKRPGTD